jgi:hypothetical protein
MKSVATLRIRLLRPLYGCLFFINEVVALDRGFIYAIAHIRGEEKI